MPGKIVSTMFTEERLDKILELVRERKRLSAEDVAAYCQVSLGTIRRDFKKLADRNQINRIHGGITAKDDFAYDSAIDIRSKEHFAVKQAIAGKAAELIGDNEVVAIDAGTTTIHAIPHLKTRNHLTIVAYSLDIANETAKDPHMTTIIVGGTIRPKTLSIVGPEAIAMLQKIHIDTLLLAASAITPEKGLMNGNSMEAEVKKVLMQNADRVILLMDSSKISKKALVAFAPIDDIDILVTDRDAEPTFLQHVAERHVEVVTV